jgi:hypothetical protein
MALQPDDIVPSESLPPFLRRLFVEQGEARLRTGWRLLLHLAMSLTLLVCFSVPLGVAYAFADLSGQKMDLSSLMLLSTTASAPSFLLATWIARRFLDKRSFVSLGLRLDRQAMVDLGAGLLISGIQMALVFLAELALGWIRLEGWSVRDGAVIEAIGGLAGWLLVYIVVGLYEEVTFRGYYLQNLSTGIGPIWGILVSSAVFSLFHMWNPGAGLMSTAGIILAGLYLAVACVRTRRLWLPIGVHIGWNFFQGPVFGFPVSGTSSFRLLRQTPTGPVPFTGGPFGPEAGLVVIPAMLLGILLVFLLTKGRQETAQQSSP